jgi:sec-independent protein translocase protein TatB
MANLGMADSLILMVLALVVFGPRRLPQIGRQIGKLMYEFRKASNDFKFQMEEELRNSEEADRRKADEERMRALAVTAVAPKLTAPEPASVTVLESPVQATAVESPYPGEGVYPPAIAEYADRPAEETAPRILPPSTGEQVAAARPNSAALAQAAREEPEEPQAEEGGAVAASEATGAESPVEPAKAEEQPTPPAEGAVPHA